MERQPFHSVEIESECADSDEQVLLDDSDRGQVVRVLVPKLARAHAHPLSLILSNDHLDEVLVAGILPETSNNLLGLFC